MSTIKSSAENLTLNADGSGNDVIIQSNGSTKAIVTAEGTVGIGTTSISFPSGTGLEVYDASVPRIKLANSTTGNASTDGFDMHVSGSDIKLWQRENANMIFATNGAERVRVQAAGGISFNGDTAAANALDDYEEGSFTPNVGGDATYHNQNGSYTKVGRLVTVKMNFQINAINSSSQNQIQGLPFTSTSVAAHVGTVGYYSGLSSSPTWIGCYADANNTTVTFIWNTGNSSTSGNNGQNIFQNSARIDISLTYQTT